MSCTKTLTPDGESDTFFLGEATPAHLAELVALDGLCFRREAWSERTWRGVLGDPSWTTVIWCPDGHVRAASVILAACPESFLASVAVHPAYRRRGAGRALLQEAVRRAREAGARWLSLEVDRDNLAALALYRRAGFSVYRRFREDGKLRVEMRRRLAGSAPPPARRRRP